jgi:heptosyltransferase-3
MKRRTDIRRADTQARERMLVFRTGQLGDMIVSLPAMWVIRQQWPDAHLTLLCDVHPGKNYVLGSEIFRGAGLFDAFEHYEVTESQSGLGRLLKKAKLFVRLRAGHFTTLFYLAPSLRSPQQLERDRRFFGAAGIRKFYGMNHFPAIPVKQAGTPLRSAGHEADLLLARLKSDGISAPEPGKGSLDLGLGEKEMREVYEWLRQLPSDGGRQWIGVGPTSKMPAKRWPVERFKEVVQALMLEFDVWPVVFGGEEDRHVGENFIQALGRGYNAAGALPLRPAASALSRCALFLGNDSGTMHLAAAVGVPCVALFSSRDWPGAWYPYGVEQRVFRTQIECEGCYLVECVERQNECLKLISADEVFDACREILAKIQNNETMLAAVKTTDLPLPDEAFTIAKRLHRGLEAEHVYLFGSHARGEGTRDSDLDFLVVVPRSSQSRYQRAVQARGFVRDIHVPKDIIVLTRAEWEKELKAPCSLSSTVLREGVALHNG